MAISKDKAQLEAARVAYINSDRRPIDVAREFGLQGQQFCKYLARNGALKAQHTRNTKKRKAGEVVELIKEAKTATLPIEIINSAKDLTDEFDRLKNDCIKQAQAIVDGIGKAVAMVDATDLKQSLLFERYANTLKLLNDGLGMFAKAPTIAIQNNLQQNLNQQKQDKAKDNALRVEIVEVDDK